MPENIFYPKGRTNPFIKNLDEYNKLYQQSLNYPQDFFGNLARENIQWIEDFDSVHNGNLQKQNGLKVEKLMLVLIVLIGI